jgi:GT2 family glycosyltransferase
MSADPAASPAYGVVVIGRNEGERLRRCLASCADAALRVYVDSDSTDGSRELARGLGVETVELDLSRGFTAARARNAGFARLLQRRPDLEFVMFVDGDCEIVSGWIPAALDELRARPELVAVCGRRRERFPDASVYNRLCDIEWNTPPGDAKAFGGDVVLRAAALRAAGGYRDDLIAGEEPELCVRLRAAGGRILRLDRDMTWHDAAMTRLGQWWKRNVRSGHAFAEGAALHGAPPESHFVAETRRALAWGAALPAAILLAGVAQPWALAALLVYPLQWARLGARLAREGRPIPWTYAAFLLLGRFPEAQGALKFFLGRAAGRRSAIIEYK